MKKQTEENLEKVKAVLLPYLPRDKILEAFARAPGDELNEKFSSAESSAALVANTFGLFIEKPNEESFPHLECLKECDWPPIYINIEEECRFPWRGGKHPWLDAVIETKEYLIGVESKRYEPFRHLSQPEFSDVYWKKAWGDKMKPFEDMRDALAKGEKFFAHLNATQLVKHAFGLRTQAHKRRKTAILLYLYAEPKTWPKPDKPPIDLDIRRLHVQNIQEFAEAVAGAEVLFRACTYGLLVRSMSDSSFPAVRNHAATISKMYDF